MKQQTDYFLSALVPYYSDFSHTLYQKAKQVYRIQGYSRDKLAPIFNKLLLHCQKEEIPVEVIHHPLDNQVVGLFTKSTKHLLYCEDCFAPQTASPLSIYLPTAYEAMQTKLKNAQTIFFEAKKIHDAKEKIYIQHMDFELLDILSRAMIDRLLKHGLKTTHQVGSASHRYFGAPLVTGNINYIDILTADIKKRYLIHGRPGSGKSTFLKKIASALQCHGYDIELYHCSMDRNSLDMVIIRELSVALLDCTAPHQIKPVDGKDEILDLYKECLPQNIDILYKAELTALEKDYVETIKSGKAALRALAEAELDFYNFVPPLNQAQANLLYQTFFEFLF